MEVKKVLTVRINKNDQKLKDYLSQFPQDEQNNALKELVRYGLSSLKDNFMAQQSIQELQDSILDLRKEQENKFEQLLKLIKSGSQKIAAETTEKEIEVENAIDEEKAKSSMKEALSMFMEF